MTSPRVSRGRQSEQWLADWFKENGWEGAERRPAGLPGSDIMGMPAFDIEVKSRRELKLTQWLKQGERSPNALPMVIHRPDGFGKEKLAIWPVTFRLDAITPVLSHWDACAFAPHNSHVISS